MSTDSWAVTYRPRRFAGVVGQALATRVLSTCVQQDRLFQVVLLHGPSGAGKTTLARVYAAALQCQAPMTVAQGEPCGACPSCLAVLAHRDPDVVEIDGASTRGIDTIRKIRELAWLAPGSRHRVILIDEAHRLTPDAWEALLVVLEEPPPLAVFLFTTTDPSSIPETVLSRALVLPVRALSIQDVAARLLSIAQVESFPTVPPPELLQAIAAAARGSMRVGIKYLETLQLTGQLTVHGLAELSMRVSPAVATASLRDWAHGTSDQLVSLVEALRSMDLPTYIASMLDAVVAAVVVGHGGDMSAVYADQNVVMLAEVFHMVGEATLWEWRELLLRESARVQEVPAERLLLAIVGQAFYLRDRSRVPNAPTTVTPVSSARPDTSVAPVVPSVPVLLVGNSIKDKPVAPLPANHPTTARDVFQEFGCAP